MYHGQLTTYNNYEKEYYENKIFADLRNASILVSIDVDEELFHYHFLTVNDLGVLPFRSRRTEISRDRKGEGWCRI